MTGIVNALASGFSAKKILNFLMRKSPQLAPQINQALAAGFSAEKIIKFLSNDVNFDKYKKNLQEQYPTESNANPLVQAENIRGKNLGADTTSKFQSVAKKGLGTAAAVGTSMALGRAIPAILQTGNLPLQAQNLPKTPEIQSSQPPIDVSQIAKEEANIPAQAPSVQPERIINPTEYLQKHGLLEKVKDLLSRGNPPQSVAAALGIKRTGEAKIDPELLQNIEEFAKQMPQEKAEQPSARMPEEVIPETEAPEAKIQKNATVITPDGLGTVKEIRNGKAIVEVDGKKHKVDEKDLNESPLPEKDLAELHDDLISAIEKETGEEVSRMAQWVGYNPETNVLKFLPYDGSLYEYDNISPEDAKFLTDVLSTRKTTGKNFIGAWVKGSKSPVGAALSQLIKKLQEKAGGKGKEYIGKTEPVYSTYSPAHKAKKKKK